MRVRRGTGGGRRCAHLGDDLRGRAGYRRGSVRVSGLKVNRAALHMPSSAEELVELLRVGSGAAGSYGVACRYSCRPQPSCRSGARATDPHPAEAAVSSLISPVAAMFMSARPWPGARPPPGCERGARPLESFSGRHRDDAAREVTSELPRSRASPAEHWLASTWWRARRRRLATMRAVTAALALWPPHVSSKGPWRPVAVDGDQRGNGEQVLAAGRSFLRTTSGSLRVCALASEEGTRAGRACAA